MKRIAAWLSGLLFVGGVGCLMAQGTRALAQEPYGGASGYYIVTRRDLRRCAPPICGGYFVKQVNRTAIRCADGVRRAECHVYDLDLSRTGLRGPEAEAFEQLFGARHGLARGTLRRTRDERGAPVDTLSVIEAWRGVALSAPRGAFYRVIDTGLVCVAYPCPSLLEQKLNTTERSPLHGIDLAASGAGPAQVGSGLAELSASGILVAGTHRKVSGPAGTGRELVASEFYSRVRPRRP
jgi:hypothetical protein